MSLTTEDLKYFNDQFGAVHTRLNEMSGRVGATESDVKHHNDPNTICPKAEATIRAHVRERHSVLKLLSIIVALTVIATFIGQILAPLWPK